MIKGSAFDHFCGVHTYGYLHSLMTAVSASPLPLHAYIEVRLYDRRHRFCSMRIQRSTFPHDRSHPFLQHAYPESSASLLQHFLMTVVITFAARIYRDPQSSLLQHLLMTVVITLAARIYRDLPSSLLQHSYTGVRFTS